ncbi:flagellar hook-basal body complex protein [Paenisporosarcina indica]|uniref:flagellar hook-basal body complex protein n=1 Tax=Paenisporosarcina indica TaxID=650093 RepID=UPI0009500D50|nr:flagellar hook-basal body complex protein [Paenisporosarcina indica]
MLRSMYAGVSGMKGFQTKLDVIGNNIANVNTIGYKKSTINFQDLLSQNLSNGGVNPIQVGLGSTTSAINVIHTPGSAMTTGVGTDLSIMGDGFFVVQNPTAGVGTTDGQYLTRAGNFVVDANGYLVTTQGYYVLGNTGNRINVASQTTPGTPPTITNFESFTISRLGEVYGEPVGGGTPVKIADIGISQPTNPAGLRKSGGSLYELTKNSGPGPIGTVAAQNTELGLGMLEMSNVDLTEEFTEMIVAQRGFQANSRTITTSDEILQEVVNLKR